MTKTEVVDRLDRIIELLEHMNDDEVKVLHKEISVLHDWRIECNSEKSTRSHLLQIIRWTGPWLIAFIFVLFEHRFKIL